ncbi:type II toxin-antitoxin system VapC family toxin [Mycobacterium riyadhense]|uniref:Ribonuclease VapC n=1 Tax=Mycobacterium riyadhense TaxID=486698 RepID=A0A1X2BYM3_9MYCO|nr:type II toxin-antitoxin system VapC family toxin [Mycobacterium riyadhense]MCV7149055.1 type II toxin-antitoxin system VapC family toxin [Mycobacterium riyadhense]ORW68777.1 ribonuclease [Mycobacterium riyadhense]VTP00253.1 Ribonuclease VapC19 [Mycobacterium riyadhense]
MKLIDTSVAVDHLRGEPAAAELLTELVNNGEEIAASELVRFELLAGVRKSELATLEAFFSALAWTRVTEDIARIGGQLARRYRRSHSGIDDVDYLIAATAIVVDADLLTTNVRHFPMFRDLQPPY